MDIILLIWFFAIYSLLGWIIETSLLFLRDHRFVDTGILKGPFCPLYGFVSIIIISLFSQFIDSNIFVFFIISVVVATISEYLTSTILEFIFKIKFWNYSKFKFNIQGRIAPIVSIFWGILCFVIMKYLHPQIFKMIFSLNYQTIIIGSVLIVIYFLTDSTYTFITLFGLKKILPTLNDLSNNIQKINRKYLRFFKAFPNLKIKK